MNTSQLPIITMFSRCLRGASTMARTALALAAVSFFLALAERTWAAEGDCRDAEVAYDTAKSTITSVELNATLFSAASKGCLALARRLIAAGASLAARDRRGAMPLAHAARAGSVAVGSIVSRRRRRDRCPRSRRRDRALPRHRGRASGDRGAAPGARRRSEPRGRAEVSPLAAAAYRGNDRIVEALLAHGARPDAVDATGKVADRLRRRARL